MRLKCKGTPLGTRILVTSTSVLTSSHQCEEEGLQMFVKPCTMLVPGSCSHCNEGKVETVGRAIYNADVAAGHA